MDQITHSPLHQQDRRRNDISSRPAPPIGKTSPELRWQLLDLVRICRERLGLRSRDVTVLRGLLSLLPPEPQPGQLTVFASNRVLTARCDGMDERTLRRRLAHLADCGLIERRPSPNGKRYQIRSPEAQVQLSYGISVAPLFTLQSHLEALAALCQQEALEARALRALIRDRLYHADAATADSTLETARLALRRKLSPDDLRDIADSLPETTEAGIAQTVDNPTISGQPAGENTEDMSARHSQNDRHIQRSDKEYSDMNRPEKIQDISIDECLALASSAGEFASSRPESWGELITLADSLAPAIGVKPPLRHLARERLGPHGCALVILGLVQAFGRIRNPGAYLNTLLQRANSQATDPIRMFRSLVRPAHAA